MTQYSCSFYSLPLLLMRKAKTGYLSRLDIITAKDVCKPWSKNNCKSDDVFLKKKRVLEHLLIIPELGRSEDLWDSLAS